MGWPTWWLSSKLRFWTQLKSFWGPWVLSERSLHCLKIQNKVWKICFPCNQQFSQNWRYCKKGIDFHFVADFGIAEEGPNSFVGGRYKTFGVDLLAWRSRIFGGLLFPVLADECGWLFVPCRCKSHSQEYLEWSLAGHFSRTRIQLVLDQFGWAQGCLVAPELPGRGHCQKCRVPGRERRCAGPPGRRQGFAISGQRVNNHKKLERKYDCLVEFGSSRSSDWWNFLPPRCCWDGCHVANQFRSWS